MIDLGVKIMGDRGTVVCRCEGVTWGDVIDAHDAFLLTSLRQLKLATRIGMGICQGRTCRPLAEGLAQELGLLSGADQLRYRPPFRPIPMRRMARLEGER